jgi:hypothetical protein
MKKLAIPILLVGVFMVTKEVIPTLSSLDILSKVRVKCKDCNCDPCKCDPCKDGKCPTPKPAPPDKPKPKRPWGNPAQPSVEGITLGGKIAPNNSPVQIDFPLSQHISNIGSHVDGAGMCVMSSIEMAARWQNIESLRGLRDWCAKQPGGGYPSKVDRQLQEYFKKLGQGFDYVQYEGTDLSLLKTALRTGRFPAVTYAGRDKVRYSGTIAHMVCLCHLDDSVAGIWDNNGTPGEIIWMSTEDFKSRWTDGGTGWAVVWIAPPPPPPPIGG